MLRSPVLLMGTGVSAEILGDHKAIYSCFNNSIFFFNFLIENTSQLYKSDLLAVSPECLDSSEKVVSTHLRNFRKMSCR